MIAWIGAYQSTYKKGFPCPFCSLTTAPGCNALAALRPLSSFTKERGPATSMALRRLALFKKSALATRDYSSPPIGFPDSQRLKRWVHGNDIKAKALDSKSQS
ncbi:hypothetical protein QUF54_00035 [Candidatus Marithioploca araucensis]|uniref:Uncharacterized protein n=1 Tax=Candidatus Marithioploca araucensis TaxID=70273 RepID=A0ABT7VQD4_9GAMM|nr:hypothetical protein [Candidatus Marithioploca araucensis]